MTEQIILKCWFERVDDVPFEALCDTIFQDIDAGSLMIIPPNISSHRIVKITVKHNDKRIRRNFENVLLVDLVSIINEYLTVPCFQLAICNTCSSIGTRYEYYNQGLDISTLFNYSTFKRKKERTMTDQRAL